MNKEIRTVEDLVKALESIINIPENHHLIAVFENNESDKIEGFICVEYGKEQDANIYTIEELLKIYGERSNHIN